MATNSEVGQPGDEPAEPQSGHGAPERLKDTVAGIWADVLSVDSVRHGDDFFELGGDSLLAMQVSSRIRRLLSVEVSVDAMFEASTVDTFTEYLGEVLAREGVAVPVPRPPAVPPNLPAGLPLDAGLVARHFVAQESRPAHVADLDFATLPPPVRGLFVHDGTLTTGLEALRGVPVVADLRLECPTEVDEDEAGWLSVPPGTTAVRRRTAIRDGASRELLVEADSIMVLDRLPERFTALLASNPKGLGAAMLDTKIEFRRELLWYGVELLPADVAGERVPPGARLAVRCYRLIHAGVPVLCIKEGFVLSSSLMRRR